MRQSHSILYTGLALLLAIPTSAATYVVRPDGIGDYPTIQDAINAAVDADIIELTDGIFRGDGNRDIEYLGKEIIVRSQSGNESTCIIDAEGTASEMHRGVLFDGEGAGAVLEGVTVRGGYHSAGAGVSVRNGGNPTITNCVIRANTGTGDGGGMRVYQSGVHTSSSTANTFEGCSFESNTAVSVGAGVYCQETSNQLVKDCAFLGNRGSVPPSPVSTPSGATA